MIIGIELSHIRDKTFIVKFLSTYKAIETKPNGEVVVYDTGQMMSSNHSNTITLDGQTAEDFLNLWKSDRETT